ncbi:META domain-containing protein [Echinicola marina]|uniref:META domain-containing protein n=1 Tax=Echinicola marina TaxID=2859768 RepID=UPI001CF66062|nr:META domain-containing protein [Echinicola marina]UCS94870.1 META domain-containing protein [Echinicola marina]
MKFLNVLFLICLLSLTFFSCSGPTDIGAHDWKVRSIKGAPATREQLADMTLKFGEDKKVSGSSICNDFKGQAVYNEEKVKFSTLYADSKPCDERFIEQAYLTSLEMSKKYSQTANRLVFYDDKGNITVELEKIN